MQKFSTRLSGLPFHWQKIFEILVAAFIFLFFYTMVGRYHLGKPHLLPLTVIDRAIPFWPWTFWIYISDYLFIALAAFSLGNWTQFAKFRQAFFAAMLLHCLCFFFYPTVYPRIPLAANSVSEQIGRIVHYLDAPTNCFPSLHVSLTFLSCLVVSQIERKYIIPAYCWAIAIVLSTLTTKQHYFYDVISGTVVALVIFAFFSKDFSAKAH